MLFSKLGIKVDIYYHAFLILENKMGYTTLELKCRSQVRSQVTDHRSGHRSDHRSHTKTIGHWTKLFLIDILLYKNKTSQGTSIIFFLF